MNNELMKLHKDLAEVRSQITESEDNIESLRQEEKEIISKIQMKEALNKPSYSATSLWCRLTNALIRKYKPMALENSEEAVKQLLQIEGALLTGGFLTQEELDKAL